MVCLIMPMVTQNPLKGTMMKGEVSDNKKLCFHCNKYSLKIGKRCKSCGTRFYMATDMRKRNAIIKIQSEEESLQWDSESMSL